MRRNQRPGDVSATEVAERRSDFVDALAKGLKVLSTFFEHDAALSNGDLAEILQLPKATVSRLIGTLVTLGYLQLDDASRGYLIGPRALRIGANVQRGMRLQRTARPLLHQLADALDLDVIFGTREGTDVLLLEVTRTKHSRLMVDSDIGSYLPLATTAIGMGYLVAAPVPEQVRLLDKLQRRHNQNDWGSVRLRVERAHAERARQRFVISVNSAGKMITAVASPLVVERGRIYSFAAVGPAMELPPKRLLEIVGPTLANMVDRLARELDGSPATATTSAWIPGL